MVRVRGEFPLILAFSPRGGEGNWKKPGEKGTGKPEEMVK